MTQPGYVEVGRQVAVGDGAEEREEEEEEAEDAQELSATSAPTVAAAGDVDQAFHPARAAQPCLSSSSPALPRALLYLWRHLNRYYVVLSVALLAISCSGTLLRNLPDTPPLLKAFWRLLFMSAVLSVGFLYQYVHADAALIDRFLSNSSLLTICVSGLSASAHFGLWIWSLNHTSLAHSLFFVSAYPLVVVAIMLAQRKCIDALEAVGVAIGLVGSALLLADTSSSSSAASETGEGGVQGVTFVGDLMAFLGAVVFVVYLYAGQRVRGWMPLFFYTFPMTFVSCVPLLFLTLLFEPTTFAGFSPQSVFGFLAPSSLVVLLLIAVLPAGLGHTGINYCVRRVSPLSISVVLTLEPVLGVVVGVLAGVEDVPGTLTIIGGPVSVCGCVLAIVGTSRREQREKAVADLAAHVVLQPPAVVTADEALLDVGVGHTGEEQGWEEGEEADDEVGQVEMTGQDGEKRPDDADLDHLNNSGPAGTTSSAAVLSKPVDPG